MAGQEQDLEGQEASNPSEPTDSLQVLLDRWSSEPDLLNNARTVEPSLLEQPQPEVKPELLQTRLITLLDQRNTQRENIFKLARNYCWAAFGLLGLMILIQIAGRCLTQRHDFNLFDGNELQFYITGVFGQFIGLLYVITKSLYNESDFKDIYKDLFHNK